MTIEIENNSPYVNGYIVDYQDTTFTLERPDNPTLYFNKEAGGSNYVTVEGDTLDGLAQRFYGDFRLWHILLAYNDYVKDYIFDLPMGITLYVPSPNQFD